MTWSRLVDSPQQARRALADPGDELDLRAAAQLHDAWSALGFVELVPGELVRPLDLSLATARDTHDLGARLSASLRPGDLVVLSGPLGAGKTALTQGIGAGLGVLGAITSPTFVLARLHRGPVPMVHADVYRLRSTGGPVDLDDLALDDDLPHSVTVVEWGEGVVEALSESRLDITLSRGTGPSGTGTDGRTARVCPVGPRWAVVQRP